jgi:dipeptidyl aminopeptidase/acylaminoacyl peptidase
MVRRSRIRRAVASAIAIGLALMLGPTPAGATFPGANGKLAFERGGNIWTGWGSMSSGRTWYERRLTSNGISRNPRWSPDGTRIVYNTTAGAIWTMSPAGRYPRQLVRERGYQPAWSPSMPGGQRIVFVRVPQGGLGDLWTVPATGGTPTRLTTDGAANCGDSWPSWSPDGSRIVYQRSLRRADGTCGATQVVVLSLATMQRRIVPIPRLDEYGDPYEVHLLNAPDFTADGSRIAFAYLIAGDGCSQSLGWYDVASGRSTLEELWYGCEGGGWVADVGPTPSGEIWIEWREWEGDNLYISYPCSTEPWECYAFSDVKRWNSPDVQPRS